MFNGTLLARRRKRKRNVAINSVTKTFKAHVISGELK